MNSRIAPSTGVVSGGAAAQQNPFGANPFAGRGGMGPGRGMPRGGPRSGPRGGMARGGARFAAPTFP